MNHLIPTEEDDVSSIENDSGVEIVSIEKKPGKNSRILNTQLNQEPLPTVDKEGWRNEHIYLENEFSTLRIDFRYTQLPCEQTDERKKYWLGGNKVDRYIFFKKQVLAHNFLLKNLEWSTRRYCIMLLFHLLMTNRQFH